MRACEETQGTFALTISGRGFESRVSPGQDQPFMDSECVSCGACVEACPTATLQEKSIIELGQPEHSAITTCAYCGVGCGFKAEMKGNTVVRMVPWKDGKANEGHSCVKGRFAWGYATHKDRITKPMIRAKITDPWREVSWDEAIDHAASEFKRIQAKHGKDSVGGITSSRCTNEEVYLVQKLIRAAFGTNNVDTCARVCHSPTGYGMGQTFGTSAGTQTFKSVEQADVIMVIGANPTDAHPVFASRMKRRLREGARLIVVDPRRIELVETPHVRADHHLALKPGTNVAMITALAHVVATEGLINEAYVAERCDMKSFNEWRAFVSRPENSPEAFEAVTGVPADEVRKAARLFASGPNSAIYYGLGVTEHAQGSTMVIGIANLAMACGMVGREGVGVNPLRGQNNVQGSCDMGSFPHELPGYRHIGDTTVRAQFEAHWGVEISPEPGLRIPNMFEAALGGSFLGLYCQGEDIVQSDPNTQHVSAALSAMECIVVQDIFLNETAKYAHVLLPGSSFLEKDGTFTNAERRISRVRQVMPPLAGSGRLGGDHEAGECAGLPHALQPPRRNHAGDRRADTELPGRELREDRPAGQRAVALQRRHRRGGHGHHARGPFRARQGQVFQHPVHPQRREDHAQVSAAAHHRPHSQPVQRGRADPAHAQQPVARRRPARDPSARCAGPRRQRRRLGGHQQPRRPDGDARADQRAHAAGRGLHHLPFPRERRQRDHHRQFGLGHQLPRVQGDGGAGHAGDAALRVAEGLRGVRPAANGLAQAGAGCPCARAGGQVKPFDEAVVNPSGVRTQTVTAWRDGACSVRPDWLAQEVPVALVFNGISHAVMLASPDDLADFALGFALTEGLLNGRDELYGIETERSEQGISLHLNVASACEWRLKERRRNLAGRTGCGLCGTESLDQVSRAVPQAPVVQVRQGVLAQAQRALREWQAHAATDGRGPCRCLVRSGWAHRACCAKTSDATTHWTS